MKRFSYVLLLICLVGLILPLKMTCNKESDSNSYSYAGSAELLRSLDSLNRELVIYRVGEVTKDFLISSKTKEADSLRLIVKRLNLSLSKTRNITSVSSTTKDTVIIATSHTIDCRNDTVGILPFKYYDSFTNIEGFLAYTTDSGVLTSDSLKLTYKVENKLHIVYSEKRPKWYKKAVPVVGVASDNPNTSNVVASVDVKKAKDYSRIFKILGGGAVLLLLLL